jgi:transcriptional regulator with XRE-family HTH domain
MSSEDTLIRRLPGALKRRRHQLGWSQRLAGEKAGFTPVELSRWETGDRTPRLKSLWRLCETYGLTPVELLREDSPVLPPDWPPEALDALRESPELREAVAAILKTKAQRGEP